VIGTGKHVPICAALRGSTSYKGAFQALAC